MLCMHEELVLETDYIEQLIFRLNKDKHHYEHYYFDELLESTSAFHEQTVDLFKKVIQDFFNLLKNHSRSKEQALNNFKIELNKIHFDSEIKIYLEENLESSQHQNQKYFKF